MGLKKRIIPIVLLDGFSVVKTIQFDVRRNLGSPITVAKTYNTRNVDELVLLDIDASTDERSIDLFTIRDIARHCFMPLTVGGGLKSISDIAETISAGADKIVLNTAAIENPQLINEAARNFGSQSIVVSIDILEGDGNWSLFSRKTRIAKHPIEFAKHLEQLGAGELIFNVIERDGKMEGPNFELAEQVANATTLPTIYAGGISSPQDCVKLGQTDLAGLGVSSIFHFTDYTPLDCKTAMSEAGIDVRIS